MGVGLSTAVAQQFPFELWHEGRIVLDTGDTLRGMVAYNMQNDVVQYQSNKKLESFTMRKVLFVEIYEASSRRYRQFYSLPYALAGQYKTPVLFELVAEGKLTVLTREALEYRTFNNQWGWGSFTRLVLVQKYFILKENGEIEAFAAKRNDWYDLMGNRSEEVRKFVRRERLDFEKKYDVAQIVSYYNSLFQK